MPRQKVKPYSPTVMSNSLASLQGPASSIDWIRPHGPKGGSYTKDWGVKLRNFIVDAFLITLRLAPVEILVCSRIGGAIGAKALGERFM